MRRARVRPAYCRLSLLARNRGDGETAKTVLRRALEVAPNHPDVLALLGETYVRLKEWPQAQQCLEKLASLHLPEESYALVAQGNVFLDTVRPEDAAKAKRSYSHAAALYRRALRVDPHNVFAANGMAAALAMQGHQREAREIFMKAREAAPDVPVIWMNLAMVYTEEGRHASAIPMYKSALQHCRDRGRSVTILQLLARALFAAGQPNESVSTFQRALHERPADDAIRCNLALALHRMAMDTLSNASASPAAVRTALSQVSCAGGYVCRRSAAATRLRPADHRYRVSVSVSAQTVHGCFGAARVGREAECHDRLWRCARPESAVPGGAEAGRQAHT